MALIKRNEISLYEEAKEGLRSLFSQVLIVFVALSTMLVLTRGNPSNGIMSLSFCSGVAFVGWAEQRRIKKSRLKVLNQNGKESKKKDSDKEKATYLEIEEDRSEKAEKVYPLEDQELYSKYRKVVEKLIDKGFGPIDALQYGLKELSAREQELALERQESLKYLIGKGYSIDQAFEITESVAQAIKKSFHTGEDELSVTFEKLLRDVIKKQDLWSTNKNNLLKIKRKIEHELRLNLDSSEQ